MARRSVAIGRSLPMPRASRTGISRGLGYRGDVMQVGQIYDIAELLGLGGMIDYVVGTPLTKVYVLAEHPDPKQQTYLNLMGEGPRSDRAIS
jgi:predicted homoserine dehydrogenase-like protein